jgi:hypothetical protein
MLQEMNRENMDDVGPIEGDQGMKVLNEMYSLTDGHDQFLNNLGPKVRDATGP